MAFYNMPLRFLKRMRDALNDGSPILPLGAAVHRLTGELASWFGLDAGYLRQGDRADFVIIDPGGLDDAVDSTTKNAHPSSAACRAWSTATTAPWWPRPSQARWCSETGNSSKAMAKRWAPAGT